MRTYLSLAFLALSLTACGNGSGGGSDGGNGNGGNVTPPPSTPTMGSRAMPGATVRVTPETAILAGQPASVIISAPDLTAGATVTAAVGVDRDSATPATVTALPANQWRAAMTLDSPLPASTCVLVTVTQANGSVLESGMEDFVLAR